MKGDELSLPYENKYSSLRKCLQQVIVEAIAPQLSHNTKTAFKTIKQMCKYVQAKRGKVLTIPKMLEDYKNKTKTQQGKKKKEKLSKECHKDLG